MRVVFCIFMAELLSIVGFCAWIHWLYTATYAAVVSFYLVSRGFHSVVIWPKIDANFKLKTIDTIVVCHLYVQICCCILV